MRDSVALKSAMQPESERGEPVVMMTQPVGTDRESVRLVPDMDEQPEVSALRAELEHLETELATIPAELETAGGGEDRILHLMVREKSLPHTIQSVREQLAELEDQRYATAIAEVGEREAALTGKLEAAARREGVARSDREAVEADLQRCEREMNMLIDRRIDARRGAQVHSGRGGVLSTPTGFVREGWL